jgi:chromosome segregation ATPase
MSTTVQTFTCPRCARGEFRSLPGTDGKAYCPWCGDAVTGGVAPPPAPVPAAPVAEAPASLDDVIARVAANAPEDAVRALRDRVAELNRACEQAQADLRRELEKKDAIKQAVIKEVERLGSRLDETKVLHQRKEDDHRAAMEEVGRLKAELEKERKRADEASSVAGNIEEMGKSLLQVEFKLQESQKAQREAQEGRDAARKEVEQVRGELGTSKADALKLREKLAAAEKRLEALKGADADMNHLKDRVLELRKRLEAERAEFKAKTAGLQTDVEKKDQRIRELQMLIKTLGERLNDLSSRRP